MDLSPGILGSGIVGEVSVILRPLLQAVPHKQAYLRRAPPRVRRRGVLKQEICC